MKKTPREFFEELSTLSRKSERIIDGLERINDESESASNV